MYSCDFWAESNDSSQIASSVSGMYLNAGIEARFLCYKRNLIFVS